MLPCVKLPSSFFIISIFSPSVLSVKQETAVARLHWHWRTELRSDEGLAFPLGSQCESEANEGLEALQRC